MTKALIFLPKSASVKLIALSIVQPKGDGVSTSQKS